MTFALENRLWMALSLAALSFELEELLHRNSPTLQNTQNVPYT